MMNDDSPFGSHCVGRVRVEVQIPKSRQVGVDDDFGYVCIKRRD